MTDAIINEVKLCKTQFDLDTVRAKYAQHFSTAVQAHEFNKVIKMQELWIQQSSKMANYKTYNIKD